MWPVIRPTLVCGERNVKPKKVNCDSDATAAKPLRWCLLTKEACVILTHIKIDLSIYLVNFTHSILNEKDRTFICLPTLCQWVRGHQSEGCCCCCVHVYVSNLPVLFNPCTALFDKSTQEKPSRAFMRWCEAVNYFSITFCLWVWTTRALEYFHEVCFKKLHETLTIYI